tara:strand:- start:152 stop:499 length:348 start_codon:yes stop_codon:yes gene_type:complete
MPCKSLTKKDVSIHIEALPDDIPVRGNASISGDEAFDHYVENAILHRLEQGDVWAWASVAVTVSWENQEAIEYLGCCCYDDEEDFQRGGYMADMIDRALDSLNDDLRTLYDRLSV